MALGMPCRCRAWLWSSHARVQLRRAAVDLAGFTSARAGLAYEVKGTRDPALLVIPGWVAYVDYDLSPPEMCSFCQRLGGGRRLICYDKRGCGPSDRTAGASALGVDTQVEDAVAVLDAAWVRRVAVLAWSAGGPVAIALAARYSRWVSRLVLGRRTRPGRCP